MAQSKENLVDEGFRVSLVESFLPRRNCNIDVISNHQRENAKEHMKNGSKS